jgi:tetratricopeptide (TPR) repeat protein
MSLKGKLFGFAALSAWCILAASERVSATGDAPALAKGPSDQALDFVNGVASGVVGNLAHEDFKAADEAYFAKLFARHPQINKNHHILAGMRASHWAALAKVLDNFEVGRPDRSDEDCNVFAKTLRDFLATAGGSRTRAGGVDEVPIYVKLPSALEKALAGRGSHVSYDGEIWRKRLVGEVLADALAAASLFADDIPPLFVDTFHGGSSGRDGWFELFVRDAAERLKDNEAFKSIWTAERLIEAKALLSEALLAREQIETKVGEVLQRLTSSVDADHPPFKVGQFWRVVEELDAAGVREDDLPQALESAVDRFVTQGKEPHEIHNESPLLDKAIQDARGKLATLDVAGAIRTLDDALAADASHEHTLKAEDEVRAHRFATARARAAVYFEKAEILQPLYQHDTVIEALETGLKFDDSGAWRWFELGDELMDIGLRAKAIAAYRSGGLKAEEEGYDSALSVSHDKIGDVLVAEGDLPAARQAYETSLAICQRLAAAEPQDVIRQWDLLAIHERLGELCVAEGNLAKTREAHEAALAIEERLAAADTGDAGWQHILSFSQDSIGYMLFREGNLPAARRAYEASFAIRERLAVADPGNAKWQRGLLISYDNLGDVLVAEGNLPAAREAHEASLAIAERLATADPGNTELQRDLAICHNRLGDVLLDDNLPAARKACEASLAIRQSLAAAEPYYSERQRDLSIGHQKLGDVLVAEGKLSDAYKAYEASHAIGERLAADEPENTEWERDLSIDHDKLGKVLLKMGNLPEARRAYEAGLVIREKLTAADPSNAQWQRDLFLSRDNLGDVLKAEGNPRGARKAYEAGFAIVERLVALDPSNTQWLRDLSTSYGNIGRMLAAEGNLPDARKAYEASLAIEERLTALDPSNAQWQHDLLITRRGLSKLLSE